VSELNKQNFKHKSKKIVSTFFKFDANLLKYRRMFKDKLTFNLIKEILCL